MKSYLINFITFNLLLVFCHVTWAETSDDRTNKDWGTIRELAITSDHGELQVLSRRYPADSTATIKDDGERQVVFVPTKKLIWIGLPTDHLVIIGERIMGFYSMKWGLRVIFSNNKSIVPDIVNQKSELEKLRQQHSAIWGESGISKDIPLWKLVGYDTLSLDNDARGPLPVTIKGVSLKDNSVILNLKSVNGKLIVLILDANLDPVSASVDGKQVYPK